MLPENISLRTALRKCRRELKNLLAVTAQEVKASP